MGILVGSRSAPKERVMRFLAAVLIALISMFTFSMHAFAATDVTVHSLYQLTAWYNANESNIKNGGTKGYSNAAEAPDGEDIINPITWEKIGYITKMESPDTTNSGVSSVDVRMWSLAKALEKSFTQATYTKAIADLSSVCTYDATTDTLSASGNKSKFDSVVSKFNANAVSQQAGSIFNDIYDMRDWDPSAGFASEALATVYSVINTIFYVGSQLLMWFFLLQTVCDGLYLVIEPVRPFIGPKDSGTGGGVNNGNGFISKIKLPIASKAAAEAANGGAVTAGGANNGSSGNIFLSYAAKRFPVLLLVAVYLILVSNGYWIKVIQWVAGFVVQIINFIMNIGQN